MKTYLVNFLLLGICNLCFSTVSAQEDSLNNLPLMFWGVDNPVCVRIEDVAHDRIDVELEGGIVNLVNIYESKYTVNSRTIGVKNLIVYVDKIEVFRKPYRVILVPYPIAFIHQPNIKEIDKNILLEHGYLECDDPNRYFSTMMNLRFTVTSFDMKINSGGMKEEFTSDNRHLTDEMKSAIKKSGVNQVITFTEIHALGPDGSLRMLPNFSLRIF
ncbi:MAG: hypothetical protein IPM71_08180 [Bacteroidota bacterium]|nr:MAG: hypothetical protein IPM71_08180 [Bacteroidota bacterium]